MIYASHTLQDMTKSRDPPAIIVKFTKRTVGGEMLPDEEKRVSRLQYTWVYNTRIRLSMSVRSGGATLTACASLVLTIELLNSSLVMTIDTSILLTRTPRSEWFTVDLENY
ncbi:hypothetical protein J6590_009013 [Homalodisca vitripennis]|nr:hypothetical protein J6590_009013 [Homalodisca vitripennis]